MAPANRAAKTAGGRRQRSKPGVKREQILQVAIESFGRYGYEEAKWADVATAVTVTAVPISAGAGAALAVTAVHGCVVTSYSNAL